MSLFHETMLVAARTMKRFVRVPPLIVATLAFPIMLLFVMLAVFSEVVEGVIDTSYVARLAPLIVISSASFGAAATAAGVFADLRSGLFDRFRTLPISPWSILFGRVLGDVARIVGVSVLVVAVAHIPGFRFTEGLLATVAFFGVVAVFATFWVWVAVCLAAFASSEEALQVLNAPTTLLFFLSSGFVPVQAFPGAVQPIVRANPLSATTETLVSLSSGGAVASPLLQTLLWTAGAGTVLALLAGWRFRSLTLT